MAITIGSSNISSLQAQKSLSDATSKVAKAYEQLSSGLRINQASDDAAGLAIATQLNSKSRVYNVGVRNVNDAISASTIAEGALNSLKAISQRQLELTEQAANGTYSTKQRNALDTEANSLVDEYNRIVSSTTFNGLSLFDPKLGSVLIQAGNSVLKEGFSDTLSRATGDGTYAGLSTVGLGGGQGTESIGTSDIDGDGKLDIVTVSKYAGDAVTVALGNGDGTFKAARTFALGSAGNALSFADLNGDGRNDVIVAGLLTEATVFLANADGTLRATSTLAAIFLQTGDFDADGNIDLVGIDSSGAAFISSGNGDETFGAARSFFTLGNADSIAVGDFNGDGALDLVSTGPSVTNILFGTGKGTFSSLQTIATGRYFGVTAGDFNGDGSNDLILANAYGAQVELLGNGNGTFQGARTVAPADGSNFVKLAADLNGDGYLDIFTSNSTTRNLLTYFGNGDGTFRSAISSSSGADHPSLLALGDFNGDGRYDVIEGSYHYVGTGNYSTDVNVLFGGGFKTSTSAHFNLNSGANALAAQSTVTANLDRIEAQLGSLGAIGSRFRTALNNLQVQSENFSAAASRIQDADIAQESSVLVRTQILQQAASSVLAQANQQPALALKLLGG